MSADPQLSVIIPAYDSQATLQRCLETLSRQTFASFEVIVVDSGPSPLGAAIIADGFPWVHLERSAQRLLPHAARNRGVSLARADRLVFTDPDVYPAPDWLARLDEAQQAFGGVIVGSVLWAGNRWLDRGAHLAKFDMWLPAGRPRRIPIAPTVNMLTPRAVLDGLGGFPGEIMIGDTVLSWRIAAAGHPITFEPRAVVEHHHVSSWGGLLRERFSRGREFASVRTKHEAWSAGRSLVQLAITLLPIRWLHLVLRTARASLDAGRGWDFALTVPIVLSAHAAWLAGEAAALLETLVGHGPG